jgi:hypothetical protein
MYILIFLIYVVCIGEGLDMEMFGRMKRLMGSSFGFL